MILFLIACEDAPKYDKFADVFEPSLTVNAGAVPPNGERLQVLVNPARVGQCRALPELTANVDGIAMTRLHGKVEKESYSYDRDCSVYEFELDTASIASRPAGEKSVVTVTDGVTTLSLETRNLFAPRTLALAGEVSAGGEVVLRWSPGGDVIATENSFAVELVAGEDKRRITPVTVTPEEVRFAIPADVHGPVTVELLGTAAIAPPLVACTGAKSCSVSRVFLVPAVEFVVP
ncbi:MAG: hypothetical protein FJ102_24040 [Deltaproteobacteria bacterium]|nr:hypothetical protein [Deltaproteobacteria bacterium]